MIKIIDINKKVRKARSIKRIKHAVTDAINGGTIVEDWVEVVMIGKNSEWTEWYPLKQFKEYNPNIVLKELEDTGD